MSAQRKYTDRDVRENPDFILAVLDYLEKYEGEFDFLVDCKMRVGMNRELTVGMVRGVLNCMRHDPRITNLPEPLPEQEGKVLPMRQKTMTVPRPVLKDCDNMDFHVAHGGAWSSDSPRFDGFDHCPGIYRINREDFAVDAIIKVPYMMSQSGKLIHKPSRTTGDAWYMYRPEPHTWGWRFFPQCDLYVRTQCKFPRIIDNPILLEETHLPEALASQVGASAHTHELCKRCFGDI